MSWVIEYPATRGSSPKSTTTHSPKRFISMRSQSSTTNCLIFSGDRTVFGLHPWRSIPECKPQASTSSKSFRIDSTVGVFVSISDVTILISDNRGPNKCPTLMRHASGNELPFHFIRATLPQRTVTAIIHTQWEMYIVSDESVHNSDHSVRRSYAHFRQK